MGKRKTGTGKKKKADERARAKAKQKEEALPFDLRLEEDGRVYTTTTRGVEVECLPIAAALEAQRETIYGSVDWPTVPTRTVEDVAGSEMTRPLTQAYIDGDEADEDQKQTWAEFQAALLLAEAEYTRLISDAQPRLLALKGVRWPDDLQAQWVEDHKWMGTPLPDDPRELKLLLFLTEVLGDTDRDMERLLMGIFRASIFDDEEVAKAEQFFRRKVGRGERPDDSGHSGDVGEGESQEEGAGVASGEDVSTGPGDEGVGSDA